MTQNISELHVLVIFSCENGSVERLALQAAVGAVQARASIRLRRLTPEGVPQNQESQRMQQDYIAPRAVDLDWADGVVVAIRGEEVSAFEGLAVSGKHAMTLRPCDTELRQAGFVLFSIPQDFNLLDPRDCCRAGRLFAEAMRTVTGPGATGSTQ